MSVKLKELKPWVEKYRPKTLNDVIGQKEIISKLKSFLNDRSIPHLLFAGDAGIGKTSTALAMVYDVQKDAMKEKITYLELNASDERGIDVVRTEIKDFAKTKPPSKIPYKMLILDECDLMTKSAQQALRRIMEQYASNCRFILICNYSSKIIPPIQSRASFIRFGNISDEDIKRRLKFISLNEGMNISLEAIDSIMYVANGDLRKAINILQSCSSIGSEVSSKDIFHISGHLKPEEIRSIVYDAIEKGFSSSYKIVNNMITQRGLSGKNIIRQIDNEINNLSFNDIIKYKIMTILGDTEKNISLGATEDVQLAAMIVRISRIKA